MALLFSVLLFIGSLFFFVYESEHAETQDTYESGALKGEVHEARKLQKRVRAEIDQFHEQLEKDLSQEEKEEFFRLLDKIKSNLKEV